jgi:hypothetical protein
VKAENPISKAKSNLVVSNMVRAVVGIGEWHKAIHAV